ncbi:MAG: SGNH/GDSL hydrolase family protein [bacterium]|nr:SGNH/GDSL hydrolase family protein [bacterium]
MPSASPLRLLALWCCLLLASSSALAGTARVYHSPADDGVVPGTLPIEPGLPFVTLFLYVDAGPATTLSGTPCVDGDGDELCAFEFTLQTTGDATLVGFVPDPAVDVVHRLGASDFAVVGGDAIDGTAGPVRVGALDLDVASPNWALASTRGSSVDASFTLTSIGATAIAAPEPRGVVPLGLALALLAQLRRRARSALAIPTLLCVTPLALAGAMPATAQDADGDGVPDVSDNCVHTANADQLDVGGLHGLAADGIGDACQCGDVNDDGSVDLLDVALYQRGLAGVTPTALPEDKCSVIGGRVDCEPNDRRTLREAIVGSGPGLAQVCQADQTVPPPPTRIVAAGDSITQGFAADCTCNAGFLGLICLLCPAGGDQPEYSWFDGASLGSSFFDFYGGPASTITSSRVSVSGAEMTAGADRFSIQVDDILSLVPIPDLVVVELGGNDVCNRDCVDPASCGNPLYDDATWTTALEAGLDKLVGFGHPTSLPIGSTVYLLGVPRVQDLYAAGVAKQTGTSNIDCDDFRDSFDVCEIATLNAVLNGEDLPTRLAAIEARIVRYNEILRDLALAYTSNANGRNPNGIEIVADYANETLPSIGTTAFGANEINGGDCFHPSVFGQSQLSSGAWSGNPR